MTIAIAGGTGTLGRRVAEELRSRGHEVRVLSRGSAEYPVDLTTGVGLAAALDGVDVVVDAANDASKQAAQVLVEGSRHLLAAEEAAGVGHHVAVSIVGCDLVPARYLQAKAEQERVVEGGPVPWTIVRATQFHELIDMALAPAARRHVMPVPRVALQTVAADDAARAVADVAEGPPRRERVEASGPSAATRASSPRRGAR